MTDEIESIRRQRLIEINAQPGSREALQISHGQVWDTEELARDYEVMGFRAPYVVVKRRRDGQVGSLEFQHNPRIHLNFVANRP